MSEHLILTLGQIRAHRPCIDGWRKLLTALGCDLPAPVSRQTISDFDGRFDPTIRVSLGDVAYSNGAADALWCARCLPDTSEVRRVVVGMILPAVKRAAKHTADIRVHRCIADVERWQGGDATVDLKAAAGAARVAAGAAGAARAAAGAARAAAAAAEAAGAAEAAEAAAWAASAAAWVTTCEAVEFGKERERQRDDIIAVSPPLALAEEAANG